MTTSLSDLFRVRCRQQLYEDRHSVVAVAAAWLLLGPVMPSAQRPQTDPMNALAERYVKLVLALGVHDPELRSTLLGRRRQSEAAAAKIPLAGIAADAEQLSAMVGELSPGDRGDEIVLLRHEYLHRQIEALRARVHMLSGVRMTFDEESRALYDAVAPPIPSRISPDAAGARTGSCRARAA